ncbi:hypothetical protein GCM10011396_08550 [Undibacterium terreum]|uniref:DUF4034 domain-containing protein n=2 Tax=Undibacterium terreum TaxID=1224302 RepID=A0A916XDK7_9BURK|nr:hypothetical protein GCM10011396_08550 [Undibacterium terreum]
MANEQRDSGSRTSSGVWDLTTFYLGISSRFCCLKKDEKAWKQAELSLKKWEAAYPRSSTAQLVHAKFLISRGWRIRGEGYSNTVRDEDWKPFLEYMEKARVYLEKHKKTASADPHWYELMEMIARVQSWPEHRFQALISEASTRYPLFYQLYFAAIDYYVPKWGGSAEAVEAFARQAMEKTKAQEGFGMYARIYWYAAQTQYYDELFSDTLVDWPTMKLGIDDVLEKYPDQWNINNFTKFACMAQDKEKTASLADRITGPAILEVWGQPGYLAQCKRWANGDPNTTWPSR